MSGARLPAEPENEAENMMVPLTLGLGIELAVLTVLTTVRVITLLAAPAMLCVSAVTEDAFWLVVGAVSLLGYVASTAAFTLLASIGQRAANRRAGR